MVSALSSNARFHGFVFSSSHVWSTSRMVSDVKLKSAFANFKVPFAAVAISAKKKLKCLSRKML